MLRSELDGKRITVWQELCAVICCDRSRAYLDTLMVKYDEKEKEYQEKKRLEEEEEELEKLNKPQSHRAHTPKKDEPHSALSV